MPYNWIIHVSHFDNLTIVRMAMYDTAQNFLWYLSMLTPILLYKIKCDSGDTVRGFVWHVSHCTNFLRKRVKIATCYPPQIIFLARIQIHTCLTVQKFHVPRIVRYRKFNWNLSQCKNVPDKCPNGHMSYFTKLFVANGQFWHMTHCTKGLWHVSKWPREILFKICFALVQLTLATVLTMFCDTYPDHVSHCTKVYWDRCRIPHMYSSTILIFTRVDMHRCHTVQCLLWFVSPYGCALFRKVFYGALVPIWFVFAGAPCTVMYSPYCKMYPGTCAKNTY